jgi:predicted dehydrogenase/threonine dehydrogenase-like Zn-dependent dehydrogenase
MKQIVQNLKSGETFLEEVPVPLAGRGKLLIQTTRSLVSLGTERKLIEFAKANLLQKARQQPDKVRQVLDKIRADGLLPTVEAVFKKLDEPLPLGYCNVGVVTEIGTQRVKVGGGSAEDEGPTSKIVKQCEMSSFRIGDRVVSNGHHAEYVCIPENLCARVPDDVGDDEAAFTVVGAIALQGVRLCNPSFGETVVVVGLGLIGLLAAQFLLANGCHVVGIDFAAEKLRLAEKWGVIPVNPEETDPVAVVMQQTAEAGADGVVVTASAESDHIISQAARMSRKRGRIILVGVVGLKLNRADFYEKELTFQVSCSYGPGRYDENYEQKGIDYPIGFVRWTENRNFGAVLQAIATGRLDVKSLITDHIPLSDFQKIYGDMEKSGSIATIFSYPEKELSKDKIEVERSIRVHERDFKKNSGTIGIIGAGNFTKMTVLPALKKCGAQVSVISSARGISGTYVAKKYGIAKSTTNYREVLNDPRVGLVMITTRHNLHAPLVIEALKAGKHAFVEKPLCLTSDELDGIIDSVSNFRHPNTVNNILTVGFNRRFSTHIQAIKNALGDNPGPMHLVGTMNAGSIPYNMWVHDIELGGGRIIGEACHYLDLLAYLAGSSIEAVCMNALEKNPRVNTDNASILLRFANGSNGVVNYFANGHRKYSKERIEVYSRGRVTVTDNFRKTKAFGFSGLNGLKTKIDKGHVAQFKLLIERLTNGGESLIPLKEIENVTRASFAAIQSLQEKRWVRVRERIF